MKWVSLLLLLILSGCVSLPRTLSPAADRTRLFPDGTYTHDVSITTKQQQKYSFKGVVRLSPEQIVVVGLSPLQTTMFSIEENRRTRQLNVQIHQQELKKHEASLREFYAVLSEFLLQRKSGSEISVKGTRIQLRHFDGNGIADVIEIAHPKFSVEVKVVGYEA